MILAILGRQPALSIAELERVFGKSVKKTSLQSVIFDSESFDIQKFGGVTKAGKMIEDLSATSLKEMSDKIVHYFSNKYKNSTAKITFGISAYNLPLTPRETQKIGLILKSSLKKHGVSMRLVPNDSPELSTATSHHNKLGLSENKVELLLVGTFNKKIIVATSLGAQNITAYANRDQVRPNRDAFVGMLPPKLAQIMINLTIGPNQNKQLTILDPFCGTGVILQEAALMGFSVYGTDLSEKMVRYARDNLNWLADTHHIQPDWYLHVGDAMDTKWRQPINAVVCESYLGQPFSAPPSSSKLNEVVENCNHIITEFLRNLRDQIEPGTPICIAVPAWRDKDGGFTHLPIINTVARFGYRPHEFMNVSQKDMLYFRDDQVVARELLVLTKA